jgi:enoyl-CoA hydratase/carnithine racemase
MEEKVLGQKKDGFNEVILNRPKKLNVLDEELVQSMGKILDNFCEERNLPVLLTGAGPKGFCAGGDVVSVIKGIEEGRSYDFFFRQEYNLDRRLYGLDHLNGFAHGIIMGGGMGLLMGCQTRVCEGQSLLAMPEVTIGFFPDVGASYFLQNLNEFWRLFLTLTGARFNGVEAYRLGLIDHLVSFDKKEQFFSLDLADETQKNLELFKKEDEEFSLKNEWLLQAPKWSSLFDFDEWARKEVANTDIHPWVRSCLHTYLGGSPVSKVVTWELFHWCVGKKLEQCFEQDLRVAEIVALHGDFKEGVRALLVDKDKNPQWKDSSLKDSYSRLENELGNVF